MLIFFLAFFPVLALPILVSFLDYITVVRSRRTKCYTIDEFKYSDDFTILIPIFGNIRYLKNIEFLKQYTGKVILCTTTKESHEFYDDIESVAKKNNFQIFKSEIPITIAKQNPNPWKLFANTLQGNAQKHIISDVARDEIIKDSFEVVQTKYCIFIDGDTIAKEPLGKMVGIFAKKGYDIASVRVLVSKDNTLMEKLQALEYKMAMDARKIYPWLTSGAATVARTEIIKDIYVHHSLFFSGGDIEIGKLAGLLNYRIGHIPFEFFTDVPKSFISWFKQRLAWCGGGFRHSIINFHRFTWRHPIFYFYTTVIVYGFIPLRWYEIISHPSVLVIVIVLYWGLTYAFHWKDRQSFFLLFPFYALFQVMIVVPLGVLSYFRMSYITDSPGLIKLRYKANSDLIPITD